MSLGKGIVKAEVFLRFNDSGTKEDSKERGKSLQEIEGRWKLTRGKRQAQYFKDSQVKAGRQLNRSETAINSRRRYRQIWPKTVDRPKKNFHEQHHEVESALVKP